jgi:hypothetical protein
VAPRAVLVLFLSGLALLAARLGSAQSQYCTYDSDCGQDQFCLCSEPFQNPCEPPLSGICTFGCRLGSSRPCNDDNGCPGTQVCVSSPPPQWSTCERNDPACECYPPGFEFPCYSSDGCLGEMVCQSDLTLSDCMSTHAPLFCLEIGATEACTLPTGCSGERTCQPPVPPEEVCRWSPCEL